MYTYLFAFTVLCLGAHVWYRRRSRLKLPPGPPKLPVIGNFFDLPREGEARVYTELSDKYGDLIHLSVFKWNIIVIGSMEILAEMFIKRSTKYSGRPYSTMLSKLMDLEWNFAFLPYGNAWREKRKLLHSQFQESTISKVKPMQAKAARDAVRGIIASPQDLFHHIHMHAAGVILQYTYGREMSPESSNLVDMARDVMVAWSKVAVPGAYVVDAIPILRFIPEWLIPGGGFKKYSREIKETAFNALNMPFDRVVAEMARNVVELRRLIYHLLAQGTARPSFVSNTLSQSGADFDPTMIKACAGASFFAGTGAIDITFRTFILAMLAYPDVQAKAQKELDDVVGRDRLPSFDDQESLPYVDALIKELSRWNPPAPLGVPHMITEADQFGDYHIPMGSAVIVNIWKILHNPKVYPDPLRYNPDRFFTGVKGVDMATSVAQLDAIFSPGRRVCPGKYFAVQQIFITIATILSVMEIRPALDERGKPIHVKPSFDMNLVSNPFPFECSIVPRGDYVHRLLDFAD